jgi:hypothetical protein
MKFADWFDRLEYTCGPVFAWAVAILVVVVGLPPALLWHFVSAGGQIRHKRPAGKNPNHLLACPTSGGAGPVAA